MVVSNDEQVHGCVLSKRDIPAVIGSVVCSATYFFYGACYSSLGVAIPSMADKLNVSSSEFGVAFTTRGFGYLVGTLLSAYLLHIPNFNWSKPFLAAVFLLINALMLFIIAGTSSFVLAVMLFSIQGVGFGGIDMLVNCAIPELWGVTRAQPWMQAMYTCFGIGAIIGPLLVGLMGYEYAFYLIAVCCFLPMLTLMPEYFARYSNSNKGIETNTQQLRLQDSNIDSNNPSSNGRGLSLSIPVPERRMTTDSTNGFQHTPGTTYTAPTPYTMRDRNITQSETVFNRTLTSISNIMSEGGDGHFGYHSETSTPQAIHRSSEFPHRINSLQEDAEQHHQHDHSHTKEQQHDHESPPLVAESLMVYSRANPQNHYNPERHVDEFKLNNSSSSPVKEVAPDTPRSFIGTFSRGNNFETLYHRQATTPKSRHHHRNKHSHGHGHGHGHIHIHGHIHSSIHNHPQHHKVHHHKQTHHKNTAGDHNGKGSVTTDNNSSLCAPLWNDSEASESDHSTPTLSGKSSTSNDNDSLVVKADKPLPHVIMYLIALFYFLYIAVESGYTGWIPTYALDSNVTDSESKAAFLSCIFWATMSAGRLIAIFVAMHLTASQMMRIKLILLTLFTMVLLIVADTNYTNLCIITAFLGFAVSSIYPLAITVVGDYGFIADERSTFVFLIGSNLGDCSLPLVIGLVMEAAGPESLLVSVFIAAILMAGIYLVVNYIGRRIQSENNAEAELTPVDSEMQLSTAAEHQRDVKTTNLTKDHLKEHNTAVENSTLNQLHSADDSQL